MKFTFQTEESNHLVPPGTVRRTPVQIPGGAQTFSQAPALVSDPAELAFSAV